MGNPGPAFALGAAVLFGLSTPAAKLLVGAADPWLLAGLLYLGSGVGLGLWRLGRQAVQRAAAEPRLQRGDLPWLAGAILAGGIVGPVLLMFGLAGGSATQAALLLNLEAPLTALLAWSAFREHLPMRIAIGMAGITAGAVLLSWEPAGLVALDPSAVLVAAACLAWAIDNNLTRKVSGGDPVQIAALKGATAGSINVLLALGRGAPWPPPPIVAGAGLVGFFGYGTSLALFVLALRGLGTARTGAYFATAPFVGAIAGVVALHEPLSAKLLGAGALMALGVWLHLTERHEHEHRHERLGHAHRHVHDEHHQHEHEPGIDPTEPHEHEHGHETLAHEHAHQHDAHHRHEHPPNTPAGEPHSHRHEHAPLRHRHPHYPDLHHRHGH
jgi:drug/metabolite transporter (DMT)-like permease